MKRLLDVVLGALALVLVSPVLLATAVAVRIRMGEPVLFRQVRPGEHGRPFTLLKFRTMSAARDDTGRLLDDAQRLTPLGVSLRRFSLDELPQLWNVLRGDLSRVGPRPLLMQYLERYSPQQARRLLVKPGITGWAQINGRNALSWDEKFALDTWYVDHQSTWLDLRILGRTLAQVAMRHGISQDGHATMPEFMGSERRSS